MEGSNPLLIDWYRPTDNGGGVEPAVPILIPSSLRDKIIPVVFYSETKYVYVQQLNLRKCLRFGNFSPRNRKSSPKAPEPRIEKAPPNPVSQQKKEKWTDFTKSFKFFRSKRYLHNENKEAVILSFSPDGNNRPKSTKNGQFFYYDRSSKNIKNLITLRKMYRISYVTRTIYLEKLIILRKPH